MEAARYLALRIVRKMGDFFMKKTAKGGKRSEEEIRMRLKNSLPWSLSRWMAKLLKKKR